jgi:phosphatidylglycerophosphate synthase
MEPYHVGDRRPLGSRNWKASQHVSEWLAKRGVSPNAISIIGMICGITAGWMFFETSRALDAWIFWLIGAVLVQLRLLANLYDGMVAVLRQIASPVGELFNEVPDRLSDAATLVGFGYAAGSSRILGFVAAMFALFLAYVRAQGKVAGAHQEFCGPMAKQQRMATVTVTAVICAVAPPVLAWRLPTIALTVIIIGAVVTTMRRLQRIAAALHQR